MDLSKSFTFWQFTFEWYFAIIHSNKAVQASYIIDPFDGGCYSTLQCSCDGIFGVWWKGQCLLGIGTTLFILCLVSTSYPTIDPRFNVLMGYGGLIQRLLPPLIDPDDITLRDISSQTDLLMMQFGTNGDYSHTQKNQC